ncbi:MAG: hypothetical protein ACKO6N_10680 [Myxococcota bacterium]
MLEAQPLFRALQTSSLELFLTAYARAGRTTASRHALRIDSTRYAALQVLPDDYGFSSLSLAGFTYGVMLSDRLAGPLAPFAKTSAAQLASAQSLWCLRGARPYRTELPEMLLIGDLPQDTFALSHALFTFVREHDAPQASEVVERLVGRHLEYDRLVGLLARVVTECSTDYRPLLLLSSALQLSARLGGEEVTELLQAVVRGTIAVQLKAPPGDLPPRAHLPPSLDEELPFLLAAQVQTGGVVELSRLRMRVRLEGADAWQAVLDALRKKASWRSILDTLSLVAAERLMLAAPSRLESHTGLHQVLEAMAQVRAVRWLMTHHPSPGALKALLQLAAYIGWLRFAVTDPAPLTTLQDQNPTRLLHGVREGLRASDPVAACSYVARYRELNLPREGLAGVLAEEGARGGTSAEACALRMLVTETALAEAEALYGSMEEGSYFQGLARVLTLVPADVPFQTAFERQSPLAEHRSVGGA